MENEREILIRGLEQSGIAPEARERLEKLMAGVDLPAFYTTVDNSRYTLGDWLRALEAFDAWLEKQHISLRPATTMVGYLECCTLMLSGSLQPPEFAKLVVQNLDRYGFDPAQDARAE